MNRKRKYVMVLVLLLAVITTAVSPIPQTAKAAVTPQIIVAPLWRPAVQLTTIDTGAPAIANPGDDIRYVEADIVVTTTVEFWAFDLVCTVNKVLLEGYTQNVDDDSDPNTSQDNHDDPNPVWWGNPWFQQDSVLIPDPQPGFSLPYNPATGQVNIAASRRGMATAIGQNGAENNLLLATLRFRVKNAVGTSPLTCTASFLDRNGKPVLTPTYKAPAPLQISQGYTIQGKATYQLRTSHAGINVDCSTDPDGSGPNPEVHAPLGTTAADGKFTIPNVRVMGHYNCLFYANITDPASGRQNDIYLAANTSFPLWEQGYSILPIELRLGNLKFDDTGGSGPQRIEDQDLGLITANWNHTGTSRLSGDANGDTKTDKADLAIVAANYRLYEEVNGFHYLYGLTRVSDPFFDNRVWLGNTYSNAVTQFIPSSGTVQYHWPTLSPDGSTIAYVRSSGQADPDARIYELYKASVATPATQVKLLARAVIGNRDAFAPSWSPDGTQIAFICTTGNSYKYDRGQLCIVGADGRNFRVIDPDNAPVTHIYPPAWLSPNTIVVGVGPTLVIFNLTSGEKVWGWDNDLPGAGSVTGTADMPLLSHGFLLYRYTPANGDEPRLRIAELENVPSEWKPNIRAWSAWQEPPAARTPFIHTDFAVNWEGDYNVLGAVDYYNASLTNGIFVNFYSDSLPPGFFVSINFDFESYNNGSINGTPTCTAPGCYPFFWQSGWFTIDGARGAPAWATNGNNFWQHDPDAPTFRHALRTTFERTP